MRTNPTPITAGFGAGFSRLTKALLLAYGGIYVVELLCEHWLDLRLTAALALHPFQSPAFHVWQIITHPFIQPPTAPLEFVFVCLMFYFFAGPVEAAFGPKRFLIFFYLSALGGAATGLLFSMAAGLNQPFLGMLPSMLALMVVFGFLSPEATILLMFVVPVKAKYISYGTILITLLTFLAKVNPAGAYHLGGILVGYGYFKGFQNFHPVQFLQLKYMDWQVRRRRARFTVINGRKKDDDTRPTIH